MHRPLLLVAGGLALLAPALRAQTFPFSVGGAGPDAINGVAYSPDGDVFITGSFSGLACFATPPGSGSCYTSAGGTDGFVAAYNPSGALFFVYYISGPGDDRGLDVVWRDGRIYVAGEFTGTTGFSQSGPDQSVISNGGIDAFVAAYDVFHDPTGGSATLVGIVPFGDTGDDTAQDLAVTADGVAATGGFTGTTDFDPDGAGFSLTSLGRRDAFVAAYDDGLAFDWAFAVGAAGDDVGNGIDLGPSQRLYVTGAFERKPDFDPGPSNRRIQSYGGRDAFVAVYATASGSPAYYRAFHLGGSTHDAGNDIAVAASGRTVVTGQFTGTASLDPNVAPSVPSAGGDDAFLGAYHVSGSVVTTPWVFPLGAAGSDVGHAVDLDECGNAVVTGAFSHTVDFDPGAGTANRTAAGSTDGFLASYPDAAPLRHVNQIGSPSTDAGLDVAARPSGEALAVGSFRQTAALTDVGFSLSSAGASDGYVVLYNVNGRRLVHLCAAPPPDMVAWWDFDARDPVPGPPTTFYDLSAPATPANDGTPQGSTWSLASGPVEPATGLTSVAYASGGAPGDRVRVPTHASLAWGMNDLTVDAWVKPAAGNVEDEVIPIVSNVGPPPGAGYEVVWIKQQEADQWTLGLYYRDDFGTGEVFISPNWVLPAGQWSHIAVRVEREVLDPPLSTRVSAFVNVWEQTMESVAASVGQASQSGPLYVGRGQYFIGPRAQFALDDVEVFYRGLSPGGPFTFGEVRSIYFDRKCRPCWTAPYQLGGPGFSEGLTAPDAPPAAALVTGTPGAFALAQNAPNPFRGSTEIRFSLPGATEVRLAVYDLTGRRVATLVEGAREAGTHALAFDATGLAAGVYFYRLEAAGNVETRRMTILR